MTDIRQAQQLIEESEIKYQDALHQLKESEERWFNAMVLSGAGFWDYDVLSDDFFFSIQMKKILGFDQYHSPPTLLKYWKEQIHPDDLSDLTALLSSKKSICGQHITAEFRIRNIKNEYIWMSTGGIAKLNEQGIPIRYSGSAYDITEKKVTELELEKGRLNAENSVKAKRRFLANVSHEIRTPLHAIVGLSEQLVQSELKPEQAILIQIIAQSSKALMNIINDVLDLSKMEEGKFRLDELIFNPQDLIRQVYDLFADQASKKKLYFNLETASAAHIAYWGDPSRIRQIFSNIISNAIKFTDKGGILLRCKIAESDEQNATLSFTCMDTGIGMSEEMKKNLFREFMQEEDSFQRKYGGSGLGLSITYELVKLMNGEIAVDSTKNKGTLVSLNIPLKKIRNPKDMPEEKPVEINLHLLKNARLLVAEDNEFNRLLMKFILEKHKISYEFAENGRVAVEKAKSGDYNLIMMDIQMPEMDGIEATRLIRNHIHPRIPIIALTANAVQEELDFFIGHGISGYLIKPFEEKNLLETIVQYL